MSALVLGAWGLAVLFNRAPAPTPARRALPIILPFIAALFWAALQTVGWLDPAWHHPFWRAASDVLDRPLAGAVALDPEGVWTGIMRLGAYAAAFWVALQYGASAARANQALRVLLGAICVYAVYGLYVHFAGTGQILWLDKWAYPGDVTATFVNKNSFGTFSGIGLVLALGFLLAGIFRTAGGDGNGRLALYEGLSFLVGPGGWLLVATVILSTSLLLSHSRGALAATTLALLGLFGGLVLAYRPPFVRVAICGMAFAGIGVLMLSMSGEGTLARVGQFNLSSEYRDEVFALTGAAIAERPGVGVGLGGFERAFSFYRDETVGVHHRAAHNLYIELAFELGIPAACLLIASSVVAGAICLAGLFRRQRARVFPAIGLAVIILSGAHSLVDFSLQIPAIALLYSVILGIAVAQSWPTRRPG